MGREQSEIARMGEALAALFGATTDLPANELTTMVEAQGGCSERVLIADHGLTSLQELGEEEVSGG